jgi:hypothetical protein
MAALFLSHFGQFDRTNLPGAWSSTANQLEARAFLLKDVVFVVDDYAPGLLDTKELEIKASRLLRSQGNLSGRGRLRADLTERPARPPRGLILGTGEQHPPGQSILARTVLIEARRDGIDFDALALVQRDACRLPHAMSGYIAWLIPQLNKLPATLKQTFLDTRASINADGSHLRIPEALAHLWLGLSCGLSYAEEINACSPAEAQDLKNECWDALLEIGRRQGQIVEEKRPTRRFSQIISALLSQGRVTLVHKNDRRPNDAPEFLGWYDAMFLYLLPDPTAKVIAQFCRDSGEPSINHDRLRRDLHEEGISKTDVGRKTATIWISEGSKRVLQLDRAKIEELAGEDLVLGPNSSPVSSPVLTGYR